jgi:peptidoglycan/xylan/chitin deacetylase (PgdA/CDA1 family)
MRARRRFSRIQSRSVFPRWPTETSLHDLYAFLFGIVEALTETPPPRLAEWPNGFSWALVLTHDVETAVGYRNVERIALIERELGYRSSWNFVPERDYRLEPDLRARLASAGFEIGVHGLRHDGRDLTPERSFARRLTRMQAYGRQWGARGFRSPGTNRSWSRIARLGFDYDSSYTDSARYEPQPGGCCSLLPYAIGEVVELPITVPQDHTVFDLLRLTDEKLWVEKAMLVRERGGMALVLTHPDYMVEGNALRAYERLLATFVDDPTVWKALPQQVSDWWRRRAVSGVERRGDGVWSLAGPAAAEGSIVFGGPGRLQPAPAGNAGRASDLHPVTAGENA